MELINEQIISVYIVGIKSTILYLRVLLDQMDLQAETELLESK